MNMADGIILGIIAISALMSVWRGFVREALSLVTWAAAFVIARTFSPIVGEWLEGTINMPSLRLSVAFALLFIVTLVAGAIFSKIIRALVKATGLSGTDRMLGMIFGALRGVLIVTVLIALFKPMLEKDEWWQSSVLAPEFSKLEGWTKEVGGQVMKLVVGYEPKPLETKTVDPEITEPNPGDIPDIEQLDVKERLKQQAIEQLKQVETPFNTPDIERE